MSNFSYLYDVPSVTQLDDLNEPYQFGDCMANTRASEDISQLEPLSVATVVQAAAAAATSTMKALISPEARTNVALRQRGYPHSPRSHYQQPPQSYVSILPASNSSGSFQQSPQGTHMSPSHSLIPSPSSSQSHREEEGEQQRPGQQIQQGHVQPMGLSFNVTIQPDEQLEGVEIAFRREDLQQGSSRQVWTGWRISRDEL